MSKKADRRRGSGSSWQMVYEAVRRIPPGRVATYGQVSRMLGERLSACAVGWALHVCPEDVPWHRVINAAGRCSTEGLPGVAPGLQKALLGAEGVHFQPDGSVDLTLYGWASPHASQAAKSRRSS